jgi:predicted Zn-dependent peptidase
MTPRKWTLLALVALLGAAPAFAQTQTPPPGGQPKDFSLPQRQSFTLENGLESTLVPYGTLPKVTVSVRVRCGDGNETANQVWLADLTGDMMQEGTATKDAEALAAAFGEMGGELNIQVGNDLTIITTDVLPEFGPEAVKLLAEIVRQPALPTSELDRLKDNLVRDLSLAKAQPQPLANERFAQALYGDHAYGRLFPTEEMIRGYDLDAVRGFYQKNFGAKRSRVYAVGVFDARAMERAIRDGFADWAAGPEPSINIPEMKTKKVVHLVDRPGAPQSTLRIGLPVVDPSNPDYTKLIVTNTLLGGFFSSRVTSNIREDKGYTYSPNSQVATNYRVAHWVQNADVSTDVTGAALKEIFHEIDRLQAEAPPSDELEGVKNYMSGVFVLQNSSRNGIVNQLSFVDLHGLSDDYLTGYVSRVHSVTPEDVREMAGKYLRDGEMTVVVVGDRSAVRAQVEPYGEVTE